MGAAHLGRACWVLPSGHLRVLPKFPKCSLVIKFATNIQLTNVGLRQRSKTVDAKAPHLFNFCLFSGYILLHKTECGP